VVPRPILVVLCAAGVAVPVSAPAQIRASEKAVVSQTVDGTVITVEYSRPQMRGRDPMPSGVFHHETMWTFGANWATTLDVTRPIRLNGQPVPAGTYSLWAEPAAGPWKVHLHPEPRLFHTQGPKPETMAVSFEVTPAKGEPTEALTFDFPEVRQDGAVLRFRWAEVQIPFQIEVEPSRKAVAMSEAEAAPYVGSWVVQFMNETNDTIPPMRMQILLANGSLRGVIDGPEPWTMEFMPTGEPHTFLPAFLGPDGQVFDVETATPMVFQVVNHKATRWATLGLDGSANDPWMWATRPEGP